MEWQEYQEAVGVFYERLDTMGYVQYNIHKPDKITGQKRQIDVWWEIKRGSHTVNILVDAKLRSSPIDIIDVDAVASLAEAVKADKAIIVTNKGWTEPAMKKAEFIGLDIRILKIEDALDLVVPNKWMMCYDCNDCVVMDWDGVLYMESTNLFFDWYAGRCRECKSLYLHCPECGSRTIIEDSDPWECSCNHSWKMKGEKLYIKFANKKRFIRIDNVPKISVEFLYWLLGYTPEYWANTLMGKILKVGTDEKRLFKFMLIPSKDRQKAVHVPII